MFIVAHVPLIEDLVRIRNLVSPRDESTASGTALMRVRPMNLQQLRINDVRSPPKMLRTDQGPVIESSDEGGEFNQAKNEEKGDGDEQKPARTRRVIGGDRGNR
jgi:hypothetical protein